MDNIIILKIITNNFVPQDFVTYSCLGCMIGFIIFVIVNMIVIVDEKIMK